MDFESDCSSEEESDADKDEDEAKDDKDLDKSGTIRAATDKAGTLAVTIRASDFSKL